MYVPLLPPVFFTRQISLMTIDLSTALHMSYIVKAATDTAVRASISTPVLPQIPIVALICIKF